MRRSGRFLVGALCALVAGCNALLGFLSPNTLTIVLVNQSPSFRVDGTLVYAEDDLPRELLDQLGSKVDFDLGPGETQRLSRDCGSVHSIRVLDADLRVIAGVSPGTSSDVRSNGDDYNCGDQIIFTFSHSAALIDFRVTATTQPGVVLLATR